MKIKQGHALKKKQTEDLRLMFIISHILKFKISAKTKKKKNTNETDKGRENVENCLSATEESNCVIFDRTIRGMKAV